MRVATQLLPTEQAVVVTVEVPMLSTSLMLRTDWNAGRTAASSWVIDDVPPATDLTIEVADTEHVVRADDAGVARFVWDGLDAGGARIGPSLAATTVHGERRRMQLGRWDPIVQGLGGFMIRSDDHLDVPHRRIHSAHGRLRGGVVVRPVPEADGHVVTRSHGRVAAHFDGDGAITRVTDARTDEVLRAFDRDEHGLTRITAASRPLEVSRTNGRTTITRGAWSLRLATSDDGRAVGLTDPSGRGITLQYDERGLLTAFTDASGFAHRHEYDQDGRLVAVTGRGTGRVGLARTATQHGHRVTMLSAEGREAWYETERLPDGTTVRRSRCCGTAPSVTRIDGETITVERADGTQVVNDRSSGERRVVRPSGTARARTARSGAITVNGRRYGLERDASGSRVTSPTGREFAVEATDEGVRVSTPDGVTELTHDEHGRVTGVSGQDATMEIEHDDRDLLHTVRWGDGRSTRFEHDGSGWLTAQHLAGERVVRQERDGAGLVRTVTTPGGDTTHFAFASPGRLASVRLPAPPGEDDSIDLTYDRDGYLVSRTVADRTPVTYRRGLSGEVEAITCGDDATTLEHEHGRLVRGTTADGQSTTIERDGAVVTGMTQSGPVPGAVRYERDDDLFLTRISSGSLAAALTHDDDGLVASIGEARLTRDDAGRVIAITAGVVEQRHEYGRAGRLARTTVTAAGQRVWSVDLERDVTGRIVRLTDSRLPTPVSYTYDEAGRLVRAFGGLDDLKIAHDPNGNPLTVDHHGTSATGEVAPGDRLVALGPTTVAYGAGAMVESIGDARLHRDGAGRVIAVATAGGRTVLRRDVRGAVVALEGPDARARRFVSGTTGRPEVVVGEDGTPRLLLAGVTVSNTPLLAIEGHRTSFLAADHVGSVRLVIDIATGEVHEARDYDAWGRLVNHVGAGAVPYGWAGGIDSPSTGLVHFPSRTYSPQLMRWLRRDPELFLGGGANLFAYANGDPVNHRDPTGRKVEICRRPTDIIPGLDAEHWWIRTDEREAGLLPDPIVSGGFLPNTVVMDHGGIADGGGFPCDPVEDVDEECVDYYLQTNKVLPVGSESQGDYGDWQGMYLVNSGTCQTFVDNVLDACSDGGYSILTDDPDAYDNWYGPDVPTAPYTPAPDPPPDETPHTPVPDHTPVGGGNPYTGMTADDAGRLWE